MIKFKYAIHKTTGIKVRYDEWLELYKEKKVLNFLNDIDDEDNMKVHRYKAEDVLLSDDFEFVYDD